MTLSIWRYSHLVLAIASSLFLLMASLTGVILAFEPISNAMKPYDVADIDELSLAKTISNLQSEYIEVLSLEVDTKFVSASVITSEGDLENIYIDPNTGKKLGTVEERAPIFTFTTNLHRSLFLKSIGRFFVGLVSLLLCFISITGILLLIKRQGGVKRIFSKVQKDYFELRYHVIISRWAFIPILIIAVTGVYLSAEKFSLLPIAPIEHDVKQEIALPYTKLAVNDFPVFQNTFLSDVKKVDFPFSEDETDYFQIALKDKEIWVHQYSGIIVSEVKYPFLQLASALSLQLHTGEGNSIWAIVLLVSSISILFFMYSGFVMFMRRRKHTKNDIVVYDKDESEIIILVGSETGNTYPFAKAFQKALIDIGKKVFLSSLNEYSTYKSAEHLVVFTSTYGEGDAPNNARLFEKRFNEIDPLQNLKFAVVGFGSIMYPKFCHFAIKTDALLQAHSKYAPLLPLWKINEQSPVDFERWIGQWNSNTGTTVTPKFKTEKRKKLKKIEFVVTERTALNNDDTFLLRLAPHKKIKFQSGDLLNIVPPGQKSIRQYSIARFKNELLLSIKKHIHGACSTYLSTLTPDILLSGSVERNDSFHFPVKASSVILIANGTGIAPFLGMIDENIHRIPVNLFWGGRTQSSFDFYKKYIDAAVKNKKLLDYRIALSKEGKKTYVQDLLIQEKDRIAHQLENGGKIMICGSIAMRNEVLEILDSITRAVNKKPLSDFENEGQLATDCY